MRQVGKLLLVAFLLCGPTYGLRAQTIGGATQLNVTTSSGRVQLPASTSLYPAVLITPVQGDAVGVYFQFGGSSVIANTSTSPALPNGGICLLAGPNTYLAAITGSSTASISITQLTQCPLFSGVNPAPTTGPGGGTVTSVAVVTANGISGTVANPTTAAAITLSLGAITPSSVAIGAGSAITSSGPGGTLTSVAFASFGTASGNAAQGGVITAGGPTGSATAAPIITYNAAGQLTAVSSATITPAIGSITGLGASVATALGINVGSPGAFVVNGGALGTPSSITLTNATGLPISTGLSGLGTGVASALGNTAGNSGSFILQGGLISPKGYTVATLPASPATGSLAYVTDALACTFLASITGGGSTYCPVSFNGASWVGG